MFLAIALGVALALLFGAVTVEWWRIRAVLQLVMAILGGLLLLKASSVALVTVVQTIR